MKIKFKESVIDLNEVAFMEYRESIYNERYELIILFKSGKEKILKALLNRKQLSDGTIKQSFYDIEQLKRIRNKWMKNGETITIKRMIKKEGNHEVIEEIIEHKNNKKEINDET
jgi:hypothetical protein